MTQSKIIILAAGASTRMGQAKQLLQYQGETLLNRTIRLALEANCGAVTVVLGAKAAQIRPTITEKAITIVQNDNWQNGMSTSLQAGLNNVLHKNPKTEAILMLLCDQPFISVALIQSFFQQYQIQKPSIVAAQYEDILGVPALFHQSVFPNLLQLKGQQGARKVIRQFEKAAIAIPFPKGRFDVDTPEQYETLKAITN